jgi:polyisoprenoid-binding protein YceI
MHHRTIALLIAVFGLLVFAACGAPTPGASAPEAETGAAAEAEVATESDTEAVAEADTETEEQSEPAPMDISGVHTFVINPEESEAAYIAEEELFADALTKYGLDPGWNTVRGTTQAVEGQITLNLDDLADALGENRFTVDMTTFTTDQNSRDDWIRTDGPRFNDFPVAEFIANDIQGAPDSYTPGEEVTFQLVGELTVREISQPKTFDVTAVLENNTLTGTASTEALLTEFDIEPPHFFNTLTVADPFVIEINFVAYAE